MIVLDEHLKIIISTIGIILIKTSKSMISNLIKLITRVSLSVKETLKLRQNTAVQSQIPDRIELFYSSGSIHYLCIINLHLLNQNRYYIKCLLPEIELFKDLHNIFFFNDNCFDLKKTKYNHVEDIIKIRNVFKKMNFTRNKKMYNFIMNKILFHSLYDFVDAKNILIEFLSLSPESIFLNRTIFEFKDGSYLNVNIPEDREFILNLWKNVNYIYINYLFKHLVENTKVFHILYNFNVYRK